MHDKRSKFNNLASGSAIEPEQNTRACHHNFIHVVCMYCSSIQSCSNYGHILLAPAKPHPLLETSQHNSTIVMHNIIATPPASGHDLTPRLHPPASGRSHTPGPTPSFWSWPHTQAPPPSFWSWPCTKSEAATGSWGWGLGIRLTCIHNVYKSHIYTLHEFYRKWS